MDAYDLSASDDLLYICARGYEITALFEVGWFVLEDTGL